MAAHCDYLFKLRLSIFCYLLTYCAGASNYCIGSMQALYGKPSVDYAPNINDELPVTDKAKATSLPDILRVDFNSCEVSLCNLQYSNVFKPYQFCEKLGIKFPWDRE